jgi:hypothetical protein
MARYIWRALPASRLNMPRVEHAQTSIQILLAFVDTPPHWGLACPRRSCAALGCERSFHQVWHKYIRVYQGLALRVVGYVIGAAKEFGVDDLLGVNNAISGCGGLISSRPDAF